MLIKDRIYCQLSRKKPFSLAVKKMSRQNFSLTLAAIMYERVCPLKRLAEANLQVLFPAEFLCAAGFAPGRQSHTNSRGGETRSGQR